MSGSLNMMADVLLRPRAAFKGFIHTGAVAPAFGCMLAAAIGVACAYHLVMHKLTGSSGSLLITIMQMSLLLGLEWVLMTGLIHFWAAVTGTRGNVLRLFTCLGAAHLPLVFYMPSIQLWVLGDTLLSAVIGALVALGVSYWTFILQVRAVVAAYHVDWVKGGLIAAGPMVAFFAFLLLMWLLGVAQFFSLFI